MNVNMTADASPVFRLSNVVYRYPGGIMALDGLSLSIETGSAVALLGANGSGKSTLLRILDGLAFPESGAVEAFGAPLTEDKLDDKAYVAEFRRRVALVFQNPDVQLFCSTVMDEIAFGPLQLGLSQDEVKQRCRDLLHLFDIERLAGRNPEQLSGGEKKRVAIASALAMAPDVLLLDEPFEGLDPKNQAFLVEFLADFKRSGKTIISATHDLSIVEEIADRVVIFNEAHQIAADGKPGQILGDQKMLLDVNLIHAHAHEHGDSAGKHAHPHAHGHGHSH